MLWIIEVHCLRRPCSPCRWPPAPSQLLRGGEPAHVADGRNEAHGRSQIDTRDGQQPFERRIVHRALGDLLVEYGQILAQPVEFAQVPHDRGRFVFRQDLPSQPRPTQPAEQIGMGARRDEMRVKDRMHFVLDPRAMPDDLVAAGNQTAEALGGRIRQLDLRQVRRSQRR